MDSGDPSKAAKGTENTLEAVIKYYNSPELKGGTYVLIYRVTNQLGQNLLLTWFESCVLV